MFTCDVLAEPDLIVSYINFVIAYHLKHVWPHLHIGCITQANYRGWYCRQRSTEMDFICNEKFVPVLNEALQTLELQPHEFLATTLISVSELLV